jgi:hypothetical protein
MKMKDTRPNASVMDRRNAARMKVLSTVGIPYGLDNASAAVQELVHVPDCFAPDIP